jgi:hypothetical protein
MIKKLNLDTESLDRELGRKVSKILVDEVNKVEEKVSGEKRGINGTKKVMF